MTCLKKTSKLKKFNNAKIVSEDFSRKDYLMNMKVKDARTLFKIRSEMVETVQDEL